MTTQQSGRRAHFQYDVHSLSEAACRKAVADRDTAFDGVFWYGVLTTGIYCRPSCPSRQPNRKNVLFFALPAAARQNGLRACRRCRPDTVDFLDPQVKLVQRVCRLIEEHAGENPGLAFLSEQVQISKYHLQRLFKKLMGISPHRYSEACRTARFKTGIRDGQSVTGALYDAGYGSSSRLYEKAAAHLGMTPATYKKGGKGMSISYTIVRSPLGWLLIASTDRGICAVMLGDTKKQLTGHVHREFPLASIERDDGYLQAQAQALLASLAGEAPHAQLPLDVQGTAFQMRVWDELRRIPRGRTVSYSELARRIGNPKATRAVASACAANPAAIITPCHRVVRQDGGLGGYRWGIDRKRSILDGEK